MEKLEQQKKEKIAFSNRPMEPHENLRQTMVKILKEVKFSINDGYSNFINIKLDSERRDYA